MFERNEPQSYTIIVTNPIELQQNTCKCELNQVEMLVKHLKLLHKQLNILTNSLQILHMSHKSITHTSILLARDKGFEPNTLEMM